MQFLQLNGVHFMLEMSRFTADAGFQIFWAYISSFPVRRCSYVYIHDGD